MKEQHLTALKHLADGLPSYLPPCSLPPLTALSLPVSQLPSPKGSPNRIRAGQVIESLAARHLLPLGPRGA
jgi:hypothetical protein